MTSRRGTHAPAEGADTSSTSNNGVLTIERAAASLSNLGHTPDGHLVYLCACLSGLGLYNIDLLGQRFVHLQSINLDRNKLTSLEGLKGMRNLAVLSAAYNNITSQGIAALMGTGRTDDEGYKGPRHGSDDYNPLRRSLQRVILHHNKIEDVSCIRTFEYAYEVDVSYNNISGDISDHAVARMGSLGILNLSNNRITSIDEWAFDGCHALQELDVSQNEIAKVNFVSLIAFSLRILRLAYNSVMECEAFSVLKKCVEIDVSSNNIYDLGEVAHLASCDALRTLRLQGNPVMKEASAGEGGGAANATTATAKDGNNSTLNGGGSAAAAMANQTTNTRSGMPAVLRPPLSAGTTADGAALLVSAEEQHEEDHEAAAADEVENERLQHRMANFGQSDGPASGNNNGGGNPHQQTRAARDLASMAARKQQQYGHGGYNNADGVAGREVVATPFNEMYLHLSRQKELNMDVATVIKRTATLLKTSQEADATLARAHGESMQFGGTATASGDTADGYSGPSSAAGPSGALGGQSGARTMLLTPEEEDMLELQQLSSEQQTRLKVLWRLPAIATLDGLGVTAEELALAQCLAGGTDRRQRQEAKDRAFGASAYGGGGAGSAGSAATNTTPKPPMHVAGGGSKAIQSLRNR